MSRPAPPSPTDDQAAAWAEQGREAAAQGRPDLALAAYDEALRRRPGQADWHNRRGLALQALGRLDEAAEAHARAVALLPGHAGAHHNLGTVRLSQGRHDEAEACFRLAVGCRPDHVLAWHALGYLLRDRKRLDESLACLERAHRLSPNHPFLAGDLLHARMLMADWGGHGQALADIRAQAAAGGLPSAPFPLLSAVDDPGLHRQMAERMVAALYPASPPPEPSAGSSGRLRLGYFSGDFREHPLTRLAAGLFEAHDRARVELHAFSWSPDTGDAMQRRVTRAFEHWHDVRGLDDAAVVAAAREAGLDVAIDLMGYTAGCRPGIFARRAAPLQLGYLGYVGTWASPAIDALVVDRPMLTPEGRAGLAESLLVLPHFQVNDRRPEPPAAASRQALGLDEAATVFCCFNAAYKLTPEVFGAWMRILQAVPDGVLMLYADNPWVAGHLQREARARGVGPRRLVFGARLPFEEYLARYRAADLFLDTCPYNAGATASDALWAGLPVLTLAGHSLASRMGASLLTALGLPELVTASVDDYVARAVALAQAPGERARLRERLAARRADAALFDPRRFARALEDGLVRMVERRRAGLPPADVEVEPAD